MKVAVGAWALWPPQKSRPWPSGSVRWSGHGGSPSFPSLGSGLCCGLLVCDVWVQPTVLVKIHHDWIGNAVLLSAICSRSDSLDLSRNSNSDQSSEHNLPYSFSNMCCGSSGGSADPGVDRRYLCVSVEASESVCGHILMVF